MKCKDCFHYEDVLDLSKTGLPLRVTKKCQIGPQILSVEYMIDRGDTESCPYYVLDKYAYTVPDC